jgi:HSP20 family protein
MAIQATIPRRLVRRSHPRRRAVHPFFGEFRRDFGFAPAAGETAFRPRIDASQTDEELRLTAELPGLEDGDFEVTVDGDVITIKGEKKVAREANLQGCACAERTSGEFSRSFRIPFDIDPESVKGSYRNGVLTVVVPKPVESQTQVRTVPIETT